MIHPETHLVTLENGPRPAGKPDECFYCGQKVGEEHKKDCVCRERTVVLIYAVRAVVTVPEDWTIDQIERHRNDGSWCASNIVSELDAGPTCLCEFSSTIFLREATAEDEFRWNDEKVTS